MINKTADGPKNGRWREMAGAVLQCRILILKFFSKERLS